MSNVDLHRLVRTLDLEPRVALEQAAALAVRHSHVHVEVAHWLAALCDQPEAADLLCRLDVSVERLQADLRDAVAGIARGDASALSLGSTLLALAREGWLTASLVYGRDRVTVGDFLLAAQNEPSLRLHVRAIAPALRNLDARVLEDHLGSLPERAEAMERTGSTANSAPRATGADEFLPLYTHDMTADARAGRVDPVIGRDGELRQVIDVLMRRRQNNPILLGEAGVGKTAIAEAFALAVAEGKVPDKLKDVRLLNLDLSLLQAGAGVKGEFERRLHGVVDEIRRSAVPVILFIDEAHGLIGAGGQAGQGDAANILKPALARGELRTIAATTWAEYKRYIERDAALTRRFQPVKVPEPDLETATRMLRALAPSLEEHHGVRIRDEALSAAVQLSARYIPARQLPDKAISLIDTAAASVALGREMPPEAIRELADEDQRLAEEAVSLARSPDAQDVRERAERIETRRSAIADRLNDLQSALDIERGLVAEIDRIDARLSGGARGTVDDPIDDKVTPLHKARDDDADAARRALFLAEEKRARAVGERPMLPHAVDRDAVAAVVARWTGVPVGKLLGDQVNVVKTLEERLCERVVGQDHALKRIGEAMRSSRAGLSDPRRPSAVFLLAGQSGTGKTETALALADLLYGGPQYLTTINMSEFKEEHKISMLLGSPPGYVGFGEGGVLTEAVRRRPYGVLLLDEIDKAHRGVQEIFYQVFDKGTLKDGEGRDVDFKNTTIVMTANVGSELLAALAADAETMPEGDALERAILPELQAFFRPAFIGRTTVLAYRPLDAAALSAIVDIQIGRISARVRDAYGARLVLGNAARKALVERAGSSELGARAIETMIGREILPPLSSFFLDAVVDNRRFAKVEISHDEAIGFSISAGAPAETSFAEPATGPADSARPARSKRAKAVKAKKAASK